MPAREPLWRNLRFLIAALLFLLFLLGISPFVFFHYIHGSLTHSVVSWLVVILYIYVLSPIVVALVVAIIFVWVAYRYRHCPGGKS